MNHQFGNNEFVQKNIKTKKQEPERGKANKKTEKERNTEKTESRKRNERNKDKKPAMQALSERDGHPPPGLTE